jgi:hypothetical protein
MQRADRVRDVLKDQSTSCGEFQLDYISSAGMGVLLSEALTAAGTA